MGELRDLVVAAQAGDQDAFGEIVRRFQDMAYAVGYAMLGDAGLAQDAAQEAFIDAYLSLPQLREPAAFPGWFRRVIVKHGDRQMRQDRVYGVPFDDALALADMATPADVVESQALRDAIHHAIAALPPQQRLVTTLFYLDGYSQKEIEDFLELPITTIKKSLFTARRRLKERLTTMLKDQIHAQRPSQTEAFATKADYFIALKTHDLPRIQAIFDRTPDLLNAQTEWGMGKEGYFWPVGDAAIHWAVATGDEALLSALLTRGAGVDTLTRSGMTPLHIAAIMRQTEMAQRLLTSAHPPAVNAQTKNGFTALHLAVLRPNPALITLLLQHGTDLNAADSGGRTPLDWATLKGNTAMMDVLTARGATRKDLEGLRDIPGLKGPIFETGLKIVEALAPLKRGGVNGVFTPLSGVGKTVVLTHLMYTVAARYGGHTVSVAVEDEVRTAGDLRLAWREWGVDEMVTTVMVRADASEAERRRAVETGMKAASELRAQGREVVLMLDGELALGEGGLAYLKANATKTGAMSDSAITIVLWGDYSAGAEPEALATLDATLTFSFERTQQGLWPAIDPLRSAAHWIMPGILSDEHLQILNEAKRLLHRYVDLHGVVERYGPGLWPHPADQTTILRARRLHRFLTQPIPNAEPWTGVPGCLLALADTLAGCRAILNGDCDDWPEEALHFTGTLAEARQKAQ